MKDRTSGDKKAGLVSIIVPVYNAGQFIAETIGYVQQQTYADWELLLVDDCSTDTSRELIGRKCEGDARIRLITQERNGGAARARNRGVREACGQYICFLDADDIWLPDKLRRELDYIRKVQQEENSDAGFVFMGYEFADASGAGLGKVVHVPERLTYRQALKNTTIFTSTVMIDRNKIADEDIYMPCVASEDTATWWQVLRAGYTAYGLDEVLAVYRRPAGSLSSNKFKAVKRIWNLYRGQEKLSVFASAFYFVFWAYRATMRRI